MSQININITVRKISNGFTITGTTDENNNRVEVYKKTKDEAITLLNDHFAKETAKISKL